MTKRHDDSNRKLPFNQRVELQLRATELISGGLGLAIIYFQRLERDLGNIAQYFLDKSDPRVGTIVTSELSFRGLINLVYSLAQHRGMDKTRLESLSDILKDCALVSERRNSLVHSSWEPEPESLTVTRYKYTAKHPKGYKAHVENVSYETLMDFTKEVSVLCLDLTELMDAHDIDWASHTTIPDLYDVTSSLLPKDLRDLDRD